MTNMGEPNSVFTTTITGNSQTSTNNSHPILDDYCTPDCLLSLKTGGPIDPQCPNGGYHLDSWDMNIHTFRQLVMQTIQHQPSQSMQRIHCNMSKPTAVYKMTLLDTGFTFIVKVAWGPAVPFQRREHDFYEHMQNLQGSCIPAYLGTLELPFIWQSDILPPGLRAGDPFPTSFIILSWAGVPVTTGIVDEANKDRAYAIFQYLKDIIRTSAGVWYDGFIWRNLCFNPYVNDFMLVDFSGATASATFDDT